MSPSWRWLVRARLPPPRRRRLSSWRALLEPDVESAHSVARLVVVDVESSGLDVYRDRLIAVGAIAIRESRIALGESFRAVLRQEKASDDENILVHRIGGTAQTEGEEPADALLRFLEFAGKSPLLGFHAPFDEIMLRRSIRTHLGEDFRREWIDLAWLAPAILPERGQRLKTLDEWCAAFGVANACRHDALADAIATGQVFQVLQHHALRTGLRSIRDLIAAARGQEWLAKHRA
jgi:DNA polymerase-3 subunit epsilon